MLALQINEKAWLRFAISNCSLTKITVYGNGYVVNTKGSNGNFEDRQT